VSTTIKIGPRFESAGCILAGLVAVHLRGDDDVTEPYAFDAAADADE
jgi:hypothetical protein